MNSHNFKLRKRRDGTVIRTFDTAEEIVPYIDSVRIDARVNGDAECWVEDSFSMRLPTEALRRAREYVKGRIRSCIDLYTAIINK